MLICPEKNMHDLNFPPSFKGQLRFKRGKLMSHFYPRVFLLFVSYVSPLEVKRQSIKHLKLDDGTDLLIETNI